FGAWGPRMRGRSVVTRGHPWSPTHFTPRHPRTVLPSRVIVWLPIAPGNTRPMFFPNAIPVRGCLTLFSSHHSLYWAYTSDDATKPSAGSHAAYRDSRNARDRSLVR